MKVDRPDRPLMTAEDVNRILAACYAGLGPITRYDDDSWTTKECLEVMEGIDALDFLLACVRVGVAKAANNGDIPKDYEHE